MSGSPKLLPREERERIHAPTIQEKDHHSDTEMQWTKTKRVDHNTSWLEKCLRKKWRKSGLGRLLFQKGADAWAALGQQLP